jgi:hypothetical protein
LDIGLGYDLEVPPDLQLPLLKFIANLNSEKYEDVPLVLVKLKFIPADKFAQAPLNVDATANEVKPAIHYLVQPFNTFTDGSHHLRLKLTERPMALHTNVEFAFWVCLEIQYWAAKGGWEPPCWWRCNSPSGGGYDWIK